LGVGLLSRACHPPSSLIEELNIVFQSAGIVVPQQDIADAIARLVFGPATDHFAVAGHGIGRNIGKTKKKMDSCPHEKKPAIADKKTCCANVDGDPAVRATYDEPLPNRNERAKVYT